MGLVDVNVDVWVISLTVAVFPFIYQSGVPGSGKAGGAAVMRGPMAGRVVTQL